MNRNRVSVNALIAAGRILLSAATTFVVYRFLLDRLGEELLGTWTLVLAITAAGAVGSLGFNGTLVKYVASADGPHQRDYRVQLLHTAVVAAGGLLFIICAALYAGAVPVLSLVVAAPLLHSAAGVLPAALVAFWLSAVASLYQSYCEGLQRYLLTNAAMLAGTLLYGLLCFLFVPRFGLAAVAAAGVVQALVTLAVLIIACRVLPDRIPLLPRRWSGDVFRRLLPYGARLQSMSVAAMLYDPVTKFLVGLFGGVGQAAYYDMASRLVTMSRQLLVGANTTLLPTIAGMHASDPDRLEDVHRRDFRLVFLAASVLLLGPGAAAGYISVAWLGSAVPGFILALILLSTGWFINTISAPSYLFFLGRGELRWPLASHLTIALLNPLLGGLLGLVGGYGGVVVGFVIALGLGSVVTIVAYEREHGRSPRKILDRSSTRILITMGGMGILCNAAFFFSVHRMSTAALLLTGVTLYTCSTVLILRNAAGIHELKSAIRSLAGPFLSTGSRAG